MPAFRRLTIPVDVAKIFALIAMTADHAPKVLALPGIINDTLGRMAFPLFAFLIIQNYCRTHAFWKYAVRLGIFGVMTSLIVTSFDGTFKNVLFTFLWGLTFLVATEHICRRIRIFNRRLLKHIGNRTGSRYLDYCRRIDLQGPFAGRQPLDPMVGILCVLSLAFSHFICHPHMVWRLAKTRKEKNHDIQNSCIRDNGPVPDGLWQ